MDLKYPLRVLVTTVILDEATGITDVYTLRIVENRLDLDRVRSDAGTVNGFPFEVYDAAYLSDWWSHSDCAMETGKDC